MNSEKLVEQDGEGQSEPGRPARRGIWLMKPLAVVMSVCWVLALIVRLTIRDSGGTISTLIFYISPLIMTSAGAVFLSVLTLWIRWYRLALIWLLMGALTGAWCYQKQFQKHHTANHVLEADSLPLRVLFWNVGDQLWSIGNMVQEIKRVDADLVALVEAESYISTEQEYWKNTFPGYRFQAGKNGFMLLSRLPTTASEYGNFGRMGRYLKINLKADVSQSGASSISEAFVVYLVDINSDILRSRKEALQKLAEEVAQEKENPVLIVGDFNTPGDSVHFNPLRKLCRNSFEQAGEGYNATWPLPLPVLDLDAIWVNSLFQVRSSENRWTWYSDHRPVVADLLLQTTPASGKPAD